MRRNRHACSGATLLELIVVLAILGVVTSVGGLAMRQSRRPLEGDQLTGVAARARARAIATGRAQHVRLQTPNGPHDLLALPDGSLLGASEAAAASRDSVVDR